MINPNRFLLGLSDIGQIQDGGVQGLLPDEPIVILAWPSCTVTLPLPTTSLEADQLKANK